GGALAHGLASGDNAGADLDRVAAHYPLALAPGALAGRAPTWWAFRTGPSEFAQQPHDGLLARGGRRAVLFFSAAALTRGKATAISARTRAACSSPSSWATRSRRAWTSAASAAVGRGRRPAGWGSSAARAACKASMRIWSK